MSVAHLKIDELEETDWLRVKLVGELDLASAAVLDQRLAELRAENVAVRLDLSELGFIDSSGVRVIMRAVTGARTNEWTLEIDPNLSPAVRRVFELVQLDRFVVGEGAEGR